MKTKRRVLFRSQGAIKRVGERVQADIGIRMAVEPALVRDLDAAEPDGIAGCEAVDVEAVAEACRATEAVRRDAGGESHGKEDRSPVTAADFASQAVVARRLAKIPGSSANSANARRFAVPTAGWSKFCSRSQW